MKRRTFLKSVFITVGIGAGSLWCTMKKRYGKFVRACKSSWYPGKVERMSDIERIGKWGG